MKIRTCLVVTISVFATLAHAVTNDLTGLLQKGLFEEEANRNLDAAISNYQNLANAFDKDRQTAATAIFRLGECYRKLGRTNEAAAQYQRIVREFGDQQTLVTLSQQNLAGLGAPTSLPAVTGGAITSDTLQQLESALVKEEADYAQKTARLDTLKKLKPEELKSALPTVAPDTQLDTLMSELDQAEQNLLRLKPEYQPDHPKYQAAKEQVDALQQRISERVDGILMGLQTQLEASEAHLKWLHNKVAIQNEIQKTGVSSAAQPANEEQSPITDEEEKEIRRIQVMIKNSPDLINAPEGEVDANGRPNLTPLGHAAELGQLRVAKFLLGAKADVNLKTHDMTPLQHAASNGHRAMVELLLASGADVDAKGSDKRTALHAAAEHGFVSVAETLLAAKADINAQDWRGITPLTFAVRNGFRPVAELLLSHGADPNIMAAKVPQGWARSEESLGGPLHFAVNKGDGSMVSLLLSNHANLDLKSPYNETALDLAAEKGAIEIARRLLDAGASPNPEQTHPGDKTPLYRAVNLQNTNMVALLLARGADPNQRFYYDGSPSENSYSAPFGVTPLMKAASLGYEAIVKLLLQNKADPNLKTDNSMTAFWYGFNRDASKVLIPLIEAGADPNQLDSTGRLPLMGVAEFDSFSSSTDRLAVARLLIEKGADVNARSPYGNTPLHWAVLYKRPELVEYLLANKADVNVANKDGKTPLAFAKEQEKSGSSGTPGYVPALPTPAPSRTIPIRPGTIMPSRGITIPNEQGSPSTPQPQPQDVVKLLHRHGALDELPNFDAIRVTREGFTYSPVIFERQSNNWDHFTLLETILAAYWPSSYPSFPGNQFDNGLKFPDLTRIIIHRPNRTAAGKEQEIKADVLNSTNGIDCAKDVALEFGDVVEIPSRDHSLDEPVVGLTGTQMNSLKDCLKRTVRLVVRGQSRDLNPNPRWANVRATLSLPAAQSLLLASSDLKHVKVTRKDPVTRKTREFIVDSTSNNSSSQDLWLQNGDVLEVPEKPTE
jgi:ankyrin repeat protein